MAEIYDFNLNSKQYLNLALEKHRLGDALSAARYARNAIKCDKRNLSAYLVLSLIYAEDSEYDIANQVLFFGMHESGDWNNEEVRRALTINFMQMNMYEVAAYYANDSDADLLDIIDEELAGDGEEFKVDELYLSYPRTDGYYKRVIAQAIELAYEEKFDEAIAKLDEVPLDVKARAEADRARLMIYSMNGDFASALKTGIEMLEKDPDNYVLRCSLAGAYLMKEDEDEAYKIAEPVFEQEDLGIEATLGLLPIAIHLNKHGKVVSLIKRACELGVRSEKSLMHWFSQALYNMGERDEARRIMAGLREYYGELSCADYYLKLYAQNPDKVEYSLNMPDGGRDVLFDRVRHVLLMSSEELAAFYRKEYVEFENFQYLFRQTVKTGNTAFSGALIAKIQSEPFAADAYGGCLVTGGLSYKAVSMLLSSLLDVTVRGGARNHENSRIVFDIVAQDRFKHIDALLPDAYGCMTGALKLAVDLAFMDIVLTDEEPNFYLEQLTNLLDSIACEEDGKLLFFKEKQEKLRSVRDEGALAGALLYGIYGEDESREAIISRYGLNARLFDKYCKILFGDDDD